MAPLPNRRARAGLALCLAGLMASGCAQIESRSSVEIMPRTESPALTLGPPGGLVTARGLDAQWTQDGDRLGLRLLESRTCASVRHVPVVRIERVDRKTAGGAMWFEYGLGAGSLGLGLAGLIRPEAFSQAAIDANGEIVRDKGTGYRIGGIFTGIGVLLLTAAVIDTVRTRDQVIYTDAYRREQGGTVTCQDPKVPLIGQTVELLVDEWSTVEPTDDDGEVRFLLPAVEDLPPGARDAIAAHAQWVEAKAKADERARVAAEKAAQEAALAEAKRSKRRGRRKSSADAPKEAAAAEPTEPVPTVGPEPEPYVVKGVLRIDKTRALAIDFVVPYALEASRSHQGRGAVDPLPKGPPPPRKEGGADGAALSAGGVVLSAEGTAESAEATSPSADGEAGSPGADNPSAEGEAAAEVAEPPADVAASAAE